jgi:FtsH-binding integral membrane protein
MSEIINQESSYTKEISREFFKNVYSYMFGALAISGILASYCGNEEFFFKYFMTSAGGISPLFYVVAFAPVGLGLLIQMAYQRLSYGVLLTLFIAYSALMGISLSVIFLVYALPTLASTFFVTAGAFAGMAILGYTTKTDLTKMGSMLYMVFIGIFIAGIVNIFMKSDMMGFVIAVLGVFVFTGLTAYHMQQLKEISKDSSMDSISRQKLSLIGGLTLYILFVNLFLSLLRLLGGRD